MPLKWSGENNSIWLIGLLALLWGRDWMETLALFALIYSSLLCYGCARACACKTPDFTLNSKHALHALYTPARSRRGALVKMGMGMAGLITSTALFVALSLGAGKFQSSLTRSLQLTALFNLYWTLLHLLPIPPFDGWCLLCGGLELAFGVPGFIGSYSIGACISAIFSIALIYAPLSLSAPNRVMLMSLFALLAYLAFVKWQAVRKKQLIDFDPHIQEILDRANRDVLAHRNSAARAALTALEANLPNTSCSYLRAKSIEALAFKLEGRLEQAKELLMPVEKRLDGEPLNLLHELAYKLGEFPSVCRLSARVHEDCPKAHIAVMNGLAFAHCRDVDSALNWLLAAKREGYETEHLLSDALFHAWSSQALKALQ